MTLGRSAFHRNSFGRSTSLSEFVCMKSERLPLGVTCAAPAYPFVTRFQHRSQSTADSTTSMEMDYTAPSIHDMTSSRRSLLFSKKVSKTTRLNVEPYTGSQCRQSLGDSLNEIIVLTGINLCDDRIFEFQCGDIKTSRATHKHNALCSPRMLYSLLYPFTLHLISRISVISAQDAGSDCRCLYNQSCWPDAQAFSSLSSSVSQPLINPLPPASACYPPGNPSGNCNEAIENRLNPIWLSNQPGAYENTNSQTYTFENGTIVGCYLNTTLGFPCEQGSVPPIGVDARTPEDVQAAVRFATEHNLRLVIKNTGHDYLGRSAARGGFMIWTHNMKNITYSPNFVPEGGSEGEAAPALTLGAGVQWGEAYAAAAQNNRFIVGGISSNSSNGASGGWVMGGGHSAFSPTYGLGVHNVLQFTVVIANGSHVIANAHHNSDLFWALRGGGGGTFGVVTSSTFRTYDLVPVVMSGINVTFSSPDVAQTVVTEFIRLHPTLSDRGWGGYSLFSNSSLFGIFLAPNISSAEANNTMMPFVNSTETSTDSSIDFFSIPFDNFHTWLTVLSQSSVAPNQVGVNVELGSRLLSREAAEQNPEETARLLLSNDYTSINFVAGGAVARVDPDSVGLNPAWRDAVAMALTSEGWEDGDSGEVVQQARQRLAQKTLRMDPISPNSGAYFNEAMLYEPDFRRTFFGNHYERLRAIKRQYDPDSIFLVAEGVGSEDWNRDLTCRAGTD